MALESYLKEVRVQLTETQLTKPKDNLRNTGRRGVENATRKSQHQSQLKKADKGMRTVVLNTEDKFHEGQIQLDNPEHYKPLEHPMVVKASLRVQQLVKELHQHNEQEVI